MKEFLFGFITLLNPFSWKEAVTQITPQLTASQYSILDVERDFFQKSLKNLSDDPNKWALQDITKRDFRTLHETWEKEYEFWILKNAFIDNEDIPVESGLFILSGDHSGTYQDHLAQSFQLTKKTYEELEETVNMACTICKNKQRIAIPCPVSCY